jgi:hypothetical protein
MSIPKGFIEVRPYMATPFLISVKDAQRMVGNKDARWDGPKGVIPTPDKSKRDIWEPKQSGYAGPLVLQLT